MDIWSVGVLPARQAVDFVKRAVEFVTGLAASHWGFVYMIG